MTRRIVMPEDKSYIIRKKSDHTVLQYVTSEGVAIWSKYWAFVFNEKEGAEMMLKLSKEPKGNVDIVSVSTRSDV